MAHSRHVGTHVQRNRRRDKGPVIPQTKRRHLVAKFKTYNEADSMIEHAEDPLGIRRLKDGFGVYRRLPVKKVKDNG